MKRKKSKIDLKKEETQAQILREKAELLTPENIPVFTKDLSPEKMQDLLQEFHIHQIELEMQNEELRHRQAELAAEKERYFDIYELAPVGYFTLNQEGEILQVNLTATILLGTPKSSLIHYSLEKFILNKDKDIFYFHRKKLLSTRQTQSCEVRMVKSDGSQFWAQLDSQHSKNGKNGLVLNVVLHDITQRKNAQRDLAIAAIAFECQNGVLITDPKGIILRVNKSFTRITGYTAQEAIGQSVSILKSDRYPESFFARLWSKLNQNERWQGEIWNKRKNGENYAELLSITAVRSEGAEVTHYVGNFSDITEDKEAEATIQLLAYYDSLTGLPNRRLLQDRITQAIGASARSGEYGAVLFVDVDHFNTLNDTCGHSVGDLLLVDIAQRLRANVRQSDTVGRHGEDEFVILLDNLSSEMTEAATMAQQLREKLLEAMKKPFNLNGVEYHCKIGVEINLLSKDNTTKDFLR
ncbi:MAG: diguanylate cyclase [Campylobacterales bacterium]|nr:diguanylate cyclase [Campylobacterales bacterium]